jgi:hypothetical protein
MRTFAAAEGWPDELARLDRHGSSGQRTPDAASLQDLMETYRIPGVSIAAAGLDGSFWSAGYGTTGADGDRVGSHTAFQACSITVTQAADGDGNAVFWSIGAPAACGFGRRDEVSQDAPDAAMRLLSCW